MALTLANQLSREGFLVDLVLTEGEGEYISFLSKNVSQTRLNGNGSVRVLIRLIRYLRNNHPDIVLSFMEINNILAIVARILSFIRVKIIITIHAVLTQEKRHSNNFNYRTSITLARYLYPLADGIVGVSQGVVHDLVKRFGISKYQCKTIYNPVDFIEGEVCQSNSLPFIVNRSSKPLILGVGTLKESKDFQNLIRAFHFVRKEKDSQLCILGEGEERSNLEKLIKNLGLENDISLPGAVNDPFPYMEQADVFVLSSIWESFGLVLIEAMMTGTPVVSTDCPTGPAEILKDGLYGRLVPVRDAREMSQAIMRTLDDPIDSKILKKRANDFSSEKIIPQYISYIESICRQSTVADA